MRSPLNPDTAPHPAELLTRQEAAQYLQCSTSTVDRLTGSGRLAYYRLGGPARIAVSDLRAYVASTRQTGGRGT